MENTTEKIIAQNLIDLRKHKNLKQAELSEAIGYSDKTISRWENGTSTPDISTLIKLAKFYNVTLEDLVSENVIGKYDEKTGKGWYVNRDNLIDDLGIGVLARPKLGYSATFVSFISLESAGQNITADNSILKDVVSEDDLGGNPILLFYK